MGVGCLQVGDAAHAAYAEALESLRGTVHRILADTLRHDRVDLRFHDDEPIPNGVYAYYSRTTGEITLCCRWSASLPDGVEADPGLFAVDSPQGQYGDVTTRSLMLDDAVAGLLRDWLVAEMIRQEPEVAIAWAAGTLSRARRDVEEARAQLTRIIRLALDGGLSKSAAARAAGTSRTHVATWLRDQP